jgi:hypothetical protein
MNFVYLFLVLATYCAPAQAYLFPKHLTKTYSSCMECTKLSQDNLHANWALTKPKNLLKSHRKIRVKSYSYTQQVTTKQLQEGVALFLHAPEAVVSITPLQKKSLPQLEFITPKRQIVPLKEASSFSNYDSIIQLKPELGYGAFILKSKPTRTQESNSYLLHVFDKYSSVYLEIELNSWHYYYGDEFIALISFQDNGDSYTIDDLSTNLISPDGEIFPLKLTQTKPNQFEARATLLSELNTRGENWSIEAEVIGKRKSGITRRTARGAFSYSIPSASLLSIKKISSKPLTFEVVLDVATASRYVLQSVLFKKEGLDKQRAVETNQSAQWLEPGIQTITFSFDNSNHLEEDTLSVGYFRLTDYGQLKTVYHYDHSIKLSELMD